MNFLLGILFFIMGFILGVFTRNILMKILNTKRKIKMAKKIIAEENKRKEFREKYDFSDCFNENEQEEK